MPCPRLNPHKASSLESSLTRQERHSMSDIFYQVHPCWYLNARQIEFLKGVTFENSQRRMCEFLSLNRNPIVVRFNSFERLLQEPMPQAMMSQGRQQTEFRQVNAIS